MKIIPDYLLFTVFGWTFDIIPNMVQDEHADLVHDVWFGIGGFKYNHKKGSMAGTKGGYLFIYYGKKYLSINVEKKAKVLKEDTE